MGIMDEKALVYQEPSKDVAQGEIDEVTVDKFTGDFSENKDYNDQMDMKRLGKEQLFNVSTSTASPLENRRH